jgi:ornithine decarboxylase
VKAPISTSAPAEPDDRHHQRHDHDQDHDSHDQDRRLRALVAEHGSPLLVLDCDRIRAQYRDLAAALPGVALHYAMKALPHPSVIATLDEEDSSFDVSTTGELRLLRALGVPTSKVIHSHPIKRDRDIREALEYGCHTFAVDNAAELAKFVPYREHVSLLLRVGFRSPDAVVDLAKKFGCPPEDAFALLELGRNLDVPVCGLSFHVGSQCGSPRAHVEAITGCCELIERARRAGLTPIRVLDIGGGFPVSYRAPVPGIEAFSAPIRQALRAVGKEVRVIAEPGRFVAGPAIEAIATVVGKAWRNGRFWYYVDDGVYGSYSGQIYDGARYPLTVISAGARDGHLGERHLSVLAGPTCDSVDLVAEDIPLPELQLGDLIVAGSMGAYTTASASEFNSIPRTKILVLNGPALPLTLAQPMNDVAGVAGHLQV